MKKKKSKKKKKKNEIKKKKQLNEKQSKFLSILCHQKKLCFSCVCKKWLTLMLKNI